MPDQVIHLVHDTFRDRMRRRRNDMGLLFIVIGVVFLIAFIGGLMSKEFKSAFWLLIIGIGLVMLGLYAMRNSKRPKGGLDIRFD